MESGFHANFQYIELNGQIFTESLDEDNEGCACLPKVITGIVRKNGEKNCSLMVREEQWEAELQNSHPGSPTALLCALGPGVWHSCFLFQLL